MPRIALMRPHSSAVSTHVLALHVANPSRRSIWPCGTRTIPSPAQGLSFRKWSHSHSRLRILEHVHLRGQSSPSGFIPYSHAEEAQEQHRTRFLSWKGLSEEQRRTAGLSGEEPKPRLLSFEAEPTFTLGRRQDNLTAEQTARLQRPLHVGPMPLLAPPTHIFIPQVRKTNRGGLTTYHGPGQLVLWPVLDMHSRLYPKYGVASYAHHLETTTQRLLAERFGIETYVERDEPGVWVSTSLGQPRKIAALGVHQRRYVTALGVAVNIHVPVTGGEAFNPWARFVPCGLDGKLVTSVAAEVGSDAALEYGLSDLAGHWAVLFEEGMLDEGKRRGERSSEGQDRLGR
ncbi:hypothetical protein E4U43_007151 [Claviceps pusilla]|uniref:lipoyl(octanoyl) transferase n=1 Tax=Claviceps pusilla TaxID=123648 RepID=A0A9P7NEX3_9HYPO|nr:hypothetical protein E4U43_007151 [Claviceps pusilla]